MVTCSKCGAKNKDDDRFCVNCGGPLYSMKSVERRGDTCFGSERRMGEECFGLPYGKAIVGIIIGFFIIIYGLSIAFNVDLGRWTGAFALLTIGILIIAGILYSHRRRSS